MQKLRLAHKMAQVTEQENAQYILDPRDNSSDENLINLLEVYFFSNLNIVKLQNIKKIRDFKDIPEKSIISYIQELKSRYNEYAGAIEIVEISKNAYKMQLKPQIYEKKEISNFTLKKPLTSLEIQILGFIAYNQPIEKGDVIDIYGTGAKKKISFLKTNGFIKEENDEFRYEDEEGKEIIEKTKLYWTTPYFAHYFQVEDDIEKIREKLSG